MLELEIISAEKNTDSEASSGSDALTLLRKVFETINEIVDQCEITCSQEGLSIQVMDSMQTCICDVFLAKELFTKYRCDRNRTLGIKTKDFLRFIKNLKIESSFSFKITQHDDASNFDIEFDTMHYKLTRSLTLYTLNIDRYDFPPQKYVVEVSFPCSYFSYITKAISTEDNIGIVAHEKQLKFQQADDRSDSVFILKDSELTNLRIENNITKTLAKKHLDVVAKASGLCNEMRISMGFELPVFFELQLSHQGYVRFFIAPKIEDEE